MDGIVRLILTLFQADRVRHFRPDRGGPCARRGSLGWPTLELFFGPSLERENPCHTRITSVKILAVLLLHLRPG